MLFLVKKPMGYAHAHKRANDEIVCDVKFGNGKFDATVTLDTLSDKIWIPATGCKTCFAEKSK